MEKIKGNEGVGGRKHENETPRTYKNETESRTTNGLIVRRLDDNKDEVCWLSSSSCSDGSDDRCFDDWEAAADALTPQNDTHTSQINKSYVGNTRAWTLNDVYRPRSLPSLGYTQHQLMFKSSNSERCFSSACPICCEDFDVTDLSFLPCPCGFQLCLFCHQRILEVDSRCPGCRHQYDSVKAAAGPALADETTYSCTKNTRI